MFKGRRKRGAGRIDTLVGKDVRIQGDLEFKGGLHLDGSVTGCVWAELGTRSRFSMSDSGRIDGSLMAPDVILNGAVRGDIVASGHVALGPAARVEGNVLYGTIEIEAGAEVRGRLVPQTNPGPTGPGAGGAEGSWMAPGSPNGVESS